MRLLKINNIAIDIDEQTAIGIDYQGYDIKNPANRFINVSNTFSIPRTAKNLKIIGNPYDIQSTSSIVYSVNYCSYWIENELIIDNAKCRIEEISDRIEIFIYQKLDIWDDLKKLKFTDFIPDFLIWMRDKYNLPLQGNYFSGNYSAFIDEYKQKTSGVYLPMFYGNLYEQPADELKEGLLFNIYLNVDYYPQQNNHIVSQGGHFCIYCKTIFEYIEDKYGIDFLTSGGVVDANIFDDIVAQKLYIPAAEIGIKIIGTAPNYQIYFYHTGENTILLPHKDTRDKPDKSLYEFVMGFIQHLNCLKDEIQINGINTIVLRRFDELKAKGAIKNWTGKMTGNYKFKPIVDGIYQNNYIKFKSIFDGGSALLNSRNITCQNKNIDLKNDLFEIDAYIGPVIDSVLNILNLGKIEAFKTFVFLIDSDDTVSITISYNSETQNDFLIYNTSLNISAYYELNSEYQLYEEILQNPKLYEVKLWLTQNDLRNFEFFKLYYFRELGGCFFINKISGFNPAKSKEPTTVEMIKISNKAPLVMVFDYWVDGINDKWTDGENDLYY